MLQSEGLDRLSKILLIPMAVDGRNKGVDTNVVRRALRLITVKQNMI